jgi:hypothetical protein
VFFFSRCLFAIGCVDALGEVEVGRDGDGEGLGMEMEMEMEQRSWSLLYCVSGKPSSDGSGEALLWRAGTFYLQPRP